MTTRLEQAAAYREGARERVVGSVPAKGDSVSGEGTYLVQNGNHLTFADSKLSVLFDSIEIVQNLCLHPVVQNGHSEEVDGRKNRKEKSLRC